MTISPEEGRHLWNTALANNSASVKLPDEKSAASTRRALYRLREVLVGEWKAAGLRTTPPHYAFSCTVKGTIVTLRRTPVEML